MIKASGQYTLKDMENYYNCMIKKNSVKAIIIAHLIVWLMFLILFRAMLSIRTFDNYFTRIIMISVLVFYIAAAFVISKIQIRSTPTMLFNSIKSKCPDMMYFYEFNDDFMIGKDSSGKTLNTKYEALFKVVETDNYFFIFTLKKAGQTLNKSAITEGSPQELRELFQKKLGGRFQIR